MEIKPGTVFRSIECSSSEYKSVLVVTGVDDYNFGRVEGYKFVFSVPEGSFLGKLD